MNMQYRHTYIRSYVRSYIYIYIYIYIYDLTFQKEEIPRLHHFKIPQLAFNQKSKTKLGRQRFAMSICANLINSSGYYSPLNCRKYKTHDISIITITLENPLKYMNQRCRKHFDCGGCISTFFPTFWQLQKVSGVLCDKISVVTKFGE